VLRNVSLYGFAKLGPAAISFLAIGLYTRLLGPSEYGSYALVVAAVSLAASLGFTWLRVGLIRLLPAFETRREVFLSTLLRGYALAVGASSVVAVVLWLIVRDPAQRRLIPLGLLLLWTQAAFELNLDLSVSRLEPVRYGLITLARAVIGVGSAWWLASIGYGVAGVIIGVMIGVIVPIIWTARRNWAGVSLGKADPEVLRDVVVYSFPLVATMSLEFIVNASDRFLLGWLKGADAVGPYAAGYDLSQQSLTVLLVTVNLAAWPAILRALEAGGEEAARPRISEQGMLLACVGFPAAAGLALVAPNIVHVFLGEAFQSSAARLVPLIALATLIGGAKSYYFDLSFQLGKATRHQVLIMTAAAGTNVICNLVWIPRFGALGAAWATIAAYAVGLVLSWWRGRSVFHIPLPWQGWLRAALATGVMSAALVPLRDGRGAAMLLVQLAVGILTFGIAAVLLDLMELRGKLSGVRQRLRAGSAS
jgi:O-antigen/teichoic acid export membrane protein